MENKKIFKTKRSLRITIVCAALVCIAAVSVFAYFSTRAKVYTDDNSSEYLRVGMSLDLLFDQINSDKTKTQITSGAALSNGATYDPSADWGTASNPYIISDIRHLQNLSVLQEVGYFYQLYISKNYDSNGNYVFTTEGGIVTSGNIMPYFLVCEPDGTPATIDGSGISFSPIGTDDYPFIGSICGAFVDGNATVNGQSSDQSILYNVTVETDYDLVDVGLFGSIGYLGDESTATSSNNMKFTGAISTVKDLLLYDTKVKVNNPSWVQTLLHVFSFSSADDDSTVPHENHHIGILVGHVSYADMENISVYYSSDSVAAIDLQHKQESTSPAGLSANYMSVSGIMGYVYNINPEYDSSTNKITRNSGISNEDVSVSAGGAGTGGGAESGIGTGYVTAKAVSDYYDDSGNILYWKDTVGDQFALLVLDDGDGTFSLGDGSDVTVVSGSTATITTTYRRYLVTRTATSTWTEFVVRSGSGTTESPYVYKYQNSTNITSYGPVNTGIYLMFGAHYDNVEEEFEALCTQYTRDKIIFGTEDTNRYYFYDGVFTFALSNGETSASLTTAAASTDRIEPTWSDGTPDNYVIGENSDSKWTANNSNGSAAVVAYLNPITNKAQLNNAINAGKNLIILYNDGTTTATNNLITLSETTDEGDYKDGDDICTVKSMSVSDIDSDLSNTLYTAFSSGKIDAATGGLELIYGTDFSTLLTNWANYKKLFFGTDISNTTTLNTVKTKYIINGNKTAVYDESSYTFPDGVATTSRIYESNNVLTEVRAEQKTYDGYYYCTYKLDENTGTDYITFTYYWSGDPGTSLGTSKINNSTHVSGSTYRWSTPTVPSSMGTAAAISTANGAALYKHDDEYYPLLYYVPIQKNSSTLAYYPQYIVGNSSLRLNTYIYGSGTKCSISEGKYTESAITYSYNVYIKKVIDATGSIFYYLNGNESAPITVNETSIGTDSDSGRFLYTYSGSSTGSAVMVSEQRDYTYTFSHSETNRYLRIMKRTNLYESETLGTETFYSIWCGSGESTSDTGTDMASLELKTDPILGDAIHYYFSKDATVSFDSNGYCMINYAYGTEANRYVNFNGTVFNGTTSSTASTAKLRVYSLEATQTASYGRITFEPTASNTSYTLNSDSYVLWPSTTLSSIGENHTTDTTYIVKQFETSGSAIAQTVSDSNLLTVEDGWQDGTYNALTASTLSKKFVIENGTSEVNIYNILNGDISGNQNYVRAPIGTTGEESYIPTGCVAFRINSENTEGHKIRVVISVPCTQYYYGELNSDGSAVVNPLDYDKDYYFCLWNVSEAGTETSTTISTDNIMEAFELPRSNCYKPGTTCDADLCTDVKSYITVDYNGTTYRSYLNGNAVLVAYEFTVYEEGVYILGSNHEFDLVYFSADASASSGRNGTQSYRMGTIDYVYDYVSGSAINKIVTVKDKDSTANTIENYQYYYPTYCLLYTSNAETPLDDDSDVYTVSDGAIEYPCINDSTIYIRRRSPKDSTTSSTVSKPTINLLIKGTSSGSAITDAAYWKLINYNKAADFLNRSADEAR